MKTQHTGILDQSELISLANSSIAWAQLEKGKLDVGYRVVQAPPLVVSSRTTNLAFKVEGAMEPRRTVIGTIASLRYGARWNGQEVSSETVAVSHECLDLRTTSLSTASAIVVDRQELPARFPNSLDVADVLKNLNRTGVSHNPIAAAQIRKYVEVVCATRGMPEQFIVGALIPLLAATLPKSSSYSVERNDIASRRFGAVRLCEKYMREHLDTRITVLDLSIICGMRSRTLVNAFLAITGFGPVDYLKRLRLNGAHRALQRANKSHTKIIDVATDWGFWHMGNFAKDYRIMFGESPSHTLLG